MLSRIENNAERERELLFSTGAAFKQLNRMLVSLSFYEVETFKLVRFTLANFLNYSDKTIFLQFSTIFVWFTPMRPEPGMQSRTNDAQHSRLTTVDRHALSDLTVAYSKWTV